MLINGKEWKLVPVEPTDEMSAEAVRMVAKAGRNWTFRDVIRTGIAAAPTPPAAQPAQPKQEPTTIQSEAPLSGHWRHSNGVVCSGTLRIFRVDFDTDPSTEFQDELLNWICSILNKAQEQPASQDEQQRRDAIELLGTDHKGMRVDYSGMLHQAANALVLGHKETGLAEMLRQLHGHLAELGLRWYDGDTAVVDEMLQLYCISSGTRRALATQGANHG